LQIELVMLVSRQGKVRLTKFYDQSYGKKDKQRIVREVTSAVLARGPKMCNFVEYKGKKVVYKRYASLFFVCLVAAEDNELIILETIHH
jgi:AP-1 complex subunit sigma 1/2